MGIPTIDAAFAALKTATGQLAAAANRLQNLGIRAALRRLPHLLPDSIPIT